MSTVAFCVLILFLCFRTNAAAQNTDPKFVSGPEFVLSADAVAAGIDGVFKAILSIDAAGNIKNVQLYGDPMWPCDTSPKGELEAVREAVEAHLRRLKFTPSMKNGKPRSSEVVLDFAIGEAFKRAVAAEEAQKHPPARLVKGGIMNGRATQLVKPFGRVVKGIVEVQVLIDEQGSVSKAGVMRGNRLNSAIVRDAACASKFSPTVLSGKAVQITGTINYILQ